MLQMYYGNLHEFPSKKVHDLLGLVYNTVDGFSKSQHLGWDV